jgi:hypothetical protein
MSHRLPAQPRRLVLALIAAILLLGSAGAPTAEAQAGGPYWSGWGLRVDFPNTMPRAPRVIYTVYYGENLPTPRVIDSTEIDISAQCSAFNLVYTAQGAQFDGSSSHIVCAVPAWRDELSLLNPALPPAAGPTVTCAAGNGPLWGAGDIRIGAQNRTHTLFDASDLGVRLSIPVSNGRAQTELALSSGAQRSLKWTISSLRNQVVIGQNGPAIVEVADHFAWLNSLTDPIWRDFFTNQVVGPTMGHYYEKPTSTQTWATPPSYALGTDASTVYIGRRASGGSFFKGELISAVIDPGCQGA